MNSKKKFYLFVMFLLLFFLTQKGYGSEIKDLPKGSIQGQVVEKGLQAPINGATVKIKEIPLQAITDSKGVFQIPDVPVGSYTLEFSCPVYIHQLKSDIIVKSKRITYVQAELTINISLSKEITVTAGYFGASPQEQISSSINFSKEEIRKAPGSAGDVSRIIYGLPSVAKVSDKVNGLVVRGGSPTENAFFIDNIEIPNINHFPIKGSSSGNIGILNVDFIQNVNFISGGFSALYGNRLSSVMDISFREGNINEFDIQLDLNFGGYGLVVEGPLPQKKGSWMFSGRRSFLDLIANAIGTGGNVPRYSDFQGKIDYDISKNHQLTFLGILGIDNISFEYDSDHAIEMGSYGDYHSLENTFGINWFFKWSENGYSNTSLSQSYTKYESEFYEIVNQDLMSEDVSKEQLFSIRNQNYFQFNKSNKIQFGFQIKHLVSNYVYYFFGHQSSTGKTIPAIKKDIQASAEKYAIYVNYIWHPFRRLNLNLGTRTDYFSYTDSFHISPRLSISYEIFKKTYLNMAFGKYMQSLPLNLLYQNDSYRELKATVANHYILGIEHMLSNSTRLTVELYSKEYNHFPLDPGQPSVFLLDEFFQKRRNSWDYNVVVDSGQARSYGIELTLQKKLAQKLYGLICASYSKARYKDLNGKWRDRIYDNRFIFSVEGGYKPSRNWEFSLRWIYAGGTPYTPFDITKSTAANSGIYDLNQINEQKNPDYHSLNIRFDKRFYFRSTNLTVYLSVWNAYNRKNVDMHIWNKIENKPDIICQWGILPLFGIEYEF